MARRTKHLQIPATRAADIPQQKFNDAVRQQMNMLGGTGIDRVLTVRDVVSGILKGIKLTGAVLDTDAQPGAGSVDADTPTVPTNVQGFAGVDTTFLTWDRPTFRGYAYTEVYRFDADSLALAQRVATSAQPMYSEYVGYGQTLYYWVRHVSVAGSNSAFHATNGITLQTKPDYQAIQDALSEQINESYLAGALLARIDLIDVSNNGGLVAQQAGLASQIVNLQQVKADSATVTTQIATAKGEAIAIAEDTAKTYTDTKTGEIKAERTIKVQVDGRVAGIGLIAGPTSGSAIFLSAEQIAIIPPGATSVANARLPFIYDAATGAILMDTTFIRDLTASLITGGVLNLNEGNIRNLTVFDSFSPPDQFLQKTHFSDALARSLAWVDPNAVSTGGTLTKNVTAAVATTTMGSFLSGGAAPSIKVSGAGPSEQLTAELTGYIDVQVLRNNVAVTVNGQTTFRINVASVLATDESLPASQRRYNAYCGAGIDGVATAVANNTTTNWSVKIVATSGLGAYAADFTIKATAFETFGSSGGIIANTNWDAVADKPATATRWPTWSEITGGRASNSGGFDCGGSSPNSFDNSFEVYNAAGGTRYGMMLWNSNGTTGDWATMIYGPNQNNRRISFGKINSATPTIFSHVTEGAYFDLDDWSLNLTGALNLVDSATRLYRAAGTRLYIDADGSANVANFSSYGLYLPRAGQTAGLYVESPIEARGGIRIGTGVAGGTIDAAGNISSPGIISGSRLYAGYDAATANAISCSNWFRSSGASGWYNQTYGAGIYSAEAGVVRVYQTGRFEVYSTAVNAIDCSGGVIGDTLGVGNASNTTGKGLSLYNGASSGMPAYGLAFSGTATFGTHGSVTSDWATYFTMGGATSRGWIFKAGNGAGGNVASISAQGFITGVRFYATSSRRKKDIYRLDSLQESVRRVKAIGSVGVSVGAYKGQSALNRWLIAEEVDEVSPEVVARNADGQVETLDYNQLIPDLYAALANALGRIEQLEQRYGH